MKKVLVILSILLLGMNNVKADSCSDSELAKLRSEAENVKVSYDELEDAFDYVVPADDGNPSKTIKAYRYSIKMNVYNITNNIYVVETNDKNNDEKYIKYSDTENGKYSFTSDDNKNYINYTFKVYSNTNNCSAKLLRTITIKKPKYNDNYAYVICKENPEVPICKRFITEDINMEGKDLVSEVNKYLEDEKNSDNKSGSNLDFFVNNKWYFIGAIGGLIAVWIAYVIINKERGRI